MFITIFYFGKHLGVIMMLKIILSGKLKNNFSSAGFLTHEVYFLPKAIIKERNKEVDPSSNFVVLSIFFKPKGDISSEDKF